MSSDNRNGELSEISKLRIIFQREVEMMEKAIQVEKEKGKAILQAKTRKLKELTKKSDELLNSLIAIENQRYTLVGELISRYKDRLESPDVNISNLTQAILYLKEEENHKNKKWDFVVEQLIRTLYQFKSSAEKLKQEVEANQKLLKRTKNLISELLDHIEKKDKTYRLNKKDVKVTNALLINQSV